MCVCLSSIGGQTTGPIMTKFGTPMRIYLGMVPTKKKLPPPHPRGVEVGILGGSKNQKSGKCHELSRKSRIFFYPPHPGGRGGGRGSKFQKCGKFHELPRKSIKKKLTPTHLAHPTPSDGGGGENVKVTKH